MKKLLLLLMAVFTVFTINSCRTSDTDAAFISSKTANVKINLLENFFSNESPKFSVESLQKAGIQLDGEKQVKTIMISPSSYMNATLSPQSDSKLYTTQMVLDDENSITLGIKYRVIVYRKSNGNYVTHQDYIVGKEEEQKLPLEIGTSYEIVSYSYKNSTLPPITEDEKNSLNSAVIQYDDNNPGFLYERKTLVPKRANEEFPVNMTFQTSLLITTVNSILPITNITNATLTPHFSDGKIFLSNGNITERRTKTMGKSLNFKGVGTRKLTAEPVFINADTQGIPLGSFSANITRGGISEKINFPNSFIITPRRVSNLNFSVGKCGAFIAPGIWKEFMCHNLGANMRMDPFTPSAAIHGAKYQWGAKTGELGRYISQADDQNPANNRAIAGWKKTPIMNSSVWNNGTEDNPIKAQKDPCPTGYRVPTESEWEGVIRNNPHIERVGTWTNDGNYTSAIYLKDNFGNPTLMLPAAGGRLPANGGVYNYNFSGHYWSSMGNKKSFGSYLNFTDKEHIITKNNLRTLAFPIRCIKE